MFFFIIINFIFKPILNKFKQEGIKSEIIKQNNKMIYLAHFTKIDHNLKKNYIKKQ